MKRLAGFALLVAVIAGSTAVARAYVYLGHNWAVTTVDYYVDPTNNDSIAGADALADIQYAADAWTSQTGSNLSFRYAGATTGAVVARDGKNQVFFRPDTTDQGWIAQSYRFWDGTGHLTDFDIVMSDFAHFFKNGAACSSGYFIRNVAIHEFGHALGLEHSLVTTATMIQGQGFCTHWKESLDPDDIAGDLSIYGAAGAASDPPPAETDTTAPVVTVTAVRSGNSKNVAITISATDAVGVIGGTVQVSGATIKTFSGASYTGTFKLKAGQIVTATAKDAAGNIGTSTATVQ